VPLRHVPVGRIAAVLALAVGIWAIARDTAQPRWKTLTPGIEFALLRGEPYCRRGSSDVALLRLDPARVRVTIHNYTRQPEHQPLPLVEWRRRLEAVAAFNAGQYYPDLSYMGLLVSGGDVISARPHPRFRAVLVASPVGGSRDAQVLDLEHTPIAGARERWREIAQSFMLFDARGRVRVRKSDQVANRTVVAQDQKGRLVVATSEGGYTLWEFAELLQRAPLALSHAMCMDGGREAELCVLSGSFRYESVGPWDESDPPAGAVPLPTVIAVNAR
jgi:hypothetical protein